MTQPHGLFSDADLQQVRERSRIDDVVREYVTLKPSGGGNLKGLCPFHDEKTPSFSVSADRGLFHCFGCGEGGDVFTFLMKIDQLTFVEAVNKLAERLGITLARTQAARRSDRSGPRRSRLTAVTAAAQAFYAAQLATPAAEPAREFLYSRGFTDDDAAHFGCGFAPGGWDSLVQHLLTAGFTVAEAIAAGVAKQGRKGPIDAFHRRLTWAITDASGDTVGFGARRIFDDDRLEAKYINTSGESRLYKKSQVLFGLHLAKRDIARQRQVVIVEGYTDVMAMHLAGITTAVATCGTAFGQQHIDVLRRYLMDSQLMRGEVIYVFDGDAAGQAAALKAFDSDQRFAAHTAIAVAPDNLDPCDLRQQRGDAALRELLRARQPLFQFAITTTLAEFNLETVEGRSGALAATAPLVARIKEPTAREGYIELLANHIGMRPAQVNAQVRVATRASRSASSRPRQRARHHTATTAAPPSAVAGPSAPGAGAGETAEEEQHIPAPDRKDRAADVERETLKLALQYPALVAEVFSMVSAQAFSQVAYRMLFNAVVAAGGPVAAGDDIAVWSGAVTQQLPAGPLHTLVTALAVEPLHFHLSEVAPHYAGAIIARMAERHAAQQETELVSALRRAEATGDKQRAAELHADLVLVTEHRRALADRARGQEVS